MANKGDNYTRKSDTGDDYADYVKDKAKAKSKAKAKARANAMAIAKAKAKLLKSLKANKWDDYASKPKFDTAKSEKGKNFQPNSLTTFLFRVVRFFSIRLADGLSVTDTLKFLPKRD